MSHASRGRRPATSPVQRRANTLRVYRVCGVACGEAWVKRVVVVVVVVVVVWWWWWWW